MDIFVEISAVIFIAALISFIMRALKQPLVVGYILTGIITGPFFLNILQSTHIVELFSKIGITILLFIVGLSLNPRVIKEVGKVSLITGVGQVLFTSLVGFFIAIFLGLDRVAAIYTSIALTFSSTIIILKLLSDKGDLHKLYGKIAIGFLIVQDIIATIILAVASSLKDFGTADSSMLIGQVVLKGGLLLVGLVFVGTKVLPRISSHAAKSQELLFLFSIAWGFGLASLFHVLGFSIEIGALVAGVLLSTTHYAPEIASRTKPLRDFFIILFFILLGSRMIVTNIASILFPATVLSLFVLVGNPLIVVILMNILGYKRRTGFLAGLTVAQISEFSLILAVLGLQIGHLSQSVVSLITLVGLITIAGSTYLILYSDKIYPKVNHLLKFFEINKSDSGKNSDPDFSYDVVLFGYDRVGDYILKAFSKIDHSFVVVDFNPTVIEKLKEKNIPALYGDVEDHTFLQELNLSKLKMIVSTIPEFKANLALTSSTKKVNPHAIIIAVSHNSKEALKLYEAGATYVIIPHHLGNSYASKLISKFGVEKNLYHEEREDHLEHLHGLLEETKSQ